MQEGIWVGILSILSSHVVYCKWDLGEFGSHSILYCTVGHRNSPKREAFYGLRIRVTTVLSTVV